jgi:Cdc6-like AAA superfamily ATPase
MRRFSSYGPPNTKIHYYVSREELISQVLSQLTGDEPDEGGHYITLWAPRQTGKTWIMQQVLKRLSQDTEFETVILPLQEICDSTDVNRVAEVIARELMKLLKLEKLPIKTLEDFYLLFERGNLSKPLILILDEFDGLEPAAIAGLVGVFRNIYHLRRNQMDKPSAEKDYLLHSLALIGVRAVLGVENVKGSPFNVQRSVHIPNLTHDEVIYLFDSYQRETGNRFNQK